MLSEKLREDFPALQQELKGKPIIYFDNACMTLKPKQVIEAVVEYYEKYPACGERSSHKLGKIVTDKFEESREAVAKFLNAKKHEEILFTKNTTESLNLLSHSLDLKKGDVVLTTDREHNSNLIPWQMLRERGVEHKIIPSNSDMTFNLEKLQEMVKGAKLVSFVHTSNLDGYTTPAKEIIKISHDAGALTIMDAAQSTPHMPIDVRKLEADFLAFSVHKALGPTGVGCLYGRQDLLKDLKPFLVGGSTVDRTTYTEAMFAKPPEKFEAGLQHYAGVIGTKATVEYLKKVGMENIHQHEQELNKIVSKELGPDVQLVGPPNVEDRGGIFSFNVKGLEAHDVAIILDERANVMCRSGQHCLHSWFHANKINGSVRASFYLYNTKEELKVFIDKMKDIIKLSD
jgi:cysteine desulfurase/selenocysteine lyase